MAGRHKEWEYIGLNQGLLWKWELELEGVGASTMSSCAVYALHKGAGLRGHMEAATGHTLHTPC